VKTIAAFNGTLFAPTDDAILEALASVIDKRNTTLEQAIDNGFINVTNVLKYHLVADQLLSSKLTDGAVRARTRAVAAFLPSTSLHTRADRAAQHLHTRADRAAQHLARKLPRPPPCHSLPLPSQPPKPRPAVPCRFPAGHPNPARPPAPHSR
jgi:hypothetical protein